MAFNEFVVGADPRFLKAGPLRQQLSDIGVDVYRFRARAPEILRKLQQFVVERWS
jgi:hypothetical protein